MEEYRSELDRLHASEALRRRLAAMADEAAETPPAPAKRGRRVPFRALTGGLAAAACLMLCVAVWRGGEPQSAMPVRQGEPAPLVQPEMASVTDASVGYALPDGAGEDTKTDEPSAAMRSVGQDDLQRNSAAQKADGKRLTLSDLLAMTDGELLALEVPAEGWDAWLTDAARQDGGAVPAAEVERLRGLLCG